jgi:CheY-like chemotaxis protein
MKRGFTILLAEDSENDVILFKHAVEKSSEKTRLKIHLAITRDGAEAVEYLSGQGKFENRLEYPFPDLVILDLKMPRVCGLDVLSWLKDREEYRRIPKILLSASAQESDIETAYRLGVNTYFQKPGGLDETRDLIHHIICYWSYTERPAFRQAGA